MTMIALRAAALLAAVSSTAFTRDAASAEAEAQRGERLAAPPSGPQARFAAFQPETYNADTRTVELVLSIGAAVNRGYWIEELEISTSAVDISRVARGLVPLLDSHNRWSLGAILGKIMAVRFETVDGAMALTATAAFADTVQGREAEAMVQRGELRGVSIGYNPTAWQVVSIDAETEVRTWRATRWELTEASLVSVPADAAAGVRSAQTPSGQAAGSPGSTAAPTSEDEDMRRSLRSGVAAAAPAPVLDAERGSGSGAAAEVAAGEGQRAAPAAPAQPAVPAAQRGFTASEAIAFVRQAETFGIGERADELVRQVDAGQISPDAARQALLDAAAERQRAATSGVAAGQGGRVIEEERDRIRAGAPAAILAGLRRSAGQAQFQPARADATAPVLRLSEEAQRQAAEPYLRHSLSELAALVIGERSMPRTAAERIEVFERAFHTTSDFPAILGGALNARLEQNYQVAQPSYRRIARQMTFADFRAHDVIRAGDFPQLQKVGQSGEIKYGTIGEKKETVAIVPYGIAFGLSRQLLVNDNLGAIDQILGSQGTQVALFEEKTFYAMKGTTGPTLAENNRAVFHASNGNLAGSGTVIDIANLSAGRSALRKQKNLQGDQMGLAPRILLVSPDKETEAEQVLAVVTVNDVAKANPFGGQLDIVVGGQLSGNAWELYVDPSLGANWTWGLLDGFQAPRLRIEDVFGQQGVKVSLEHDFGCGAADFRFGYRNPGN